MQATTRWLITGASLILLCCAAATQEKSYPPAQLNQIVDFMEKAQAGVRPSISYQIVKEYRLSGSKDSRSDSDVVAEVDFQTSDKMDYRIQKSSGSDRGVQVVRHLLDHEVTSPSHRGRTALTRDNYDFSYISEATLAGQRCYILGLTPRRKETDLIAGRLWVDEHSFVVRRIEGDLAKSPSWWLRRVSVKLDFSEVGGAWLQTEMEATADVRVAGLYTLKSHMLDYRPASDFASAGSIQSVPNKP